MKPLAATIVVVLLGWLSGSVCRAATLKGMVRDQASGQAIGQATVRLEKPVRATLSDYQGRFWLNRLAAGSYVLTVSALGYQSYSQPVVLDADQPLDVQIRLQAVPIKLAEVQVLGFLSNGADRTAQQIARNAPQLTTVVGAETIDKSSDMTIADVTQRISGLSVLRDNTGQATKTVIRGTDPKYNYTLVNGLKIPSPDDRGRYIPLDLFPADLVQRVEVSKSLLPSMEGDAIGGVVNLVLNEAPARPLLKVKLATGYHQTFFTKPFTRFDAGAVRSKSPYEVNGPDYYATTSDFTKDNLSFRQQTPLPHGLANLVWSRRWLNNRLGLLVVVDYQSIRRGAISSFMPQSAEPQLNNVPSLTNYFVRDFSTNLTRKNGHANLDYSISTRHKLRLYQFWMQQRETETRFTIDTSLSQGRTIPGTGRITLGHRARVHDQSLYSAALQGQHQLLEPLTASWSANYAVATGAYPDWAELSASTGRLETAGQAIQSTPLLLNGMTRTWLRNTERDGSGKVDLAYGLPLLTNRLSLLAGGLYRQKNRTNSFVSYSFRPAFTGSSNQLFTDIYQAQWADNGPINPLGSVANPNTFTATEQITAGYAAARFTTETLDWTAGIRLENTRQAFVSSVNAQVSAGKDVSIHYLDLLPSTSLRVDISPKDRLRLAYFNSISRPALYDVTFYSIQYEDYVEAGNPFLNRTRATNAELSYERVRNPSDFWQVSGFYKHLTDPYERTLLNANDLLFPIPDAGLSYTPAGQLTSQLKNVAPATLIGGELSFAQSIGRFTLTGNYTYTWSALTQVKKIKVRQNPEDPSSNIITSSQPQVRPLQGQSPHLANLSLRYAAPKTGFTGQISAVYTGNRIFAASGWYGLDYWQRGYTQVDLSVEQHLQSRWRLFAKVSNLLNASTIVELRQPNAAYALAIVPGQESGRQFTVMRQYDTAMFYAGVQLIW